MEKLVPETKENKTLIWFRKKIKVLVDAEITKRDAGSEYLDDLSKVNSKELNEKDLEMFDLIMPIKRKIPKGEAGFYLEDFDRYKTEARRSGNMSRFNFATYLADRLAEKL